MLMLIVVAAAKVCAFYKILLSSRVSFLFPFLSRLLSAPSLF